MVKAFGEEQDIGVSGVSPVTGSYNVRDPSFGNFSAGINSFIDTISKASKEAARIKADKLLGKAIEDAQGVLDNAVASGKGPAAIKMLRQRLVSKIGGEYGADALAAARTTLEGYTTQQKLDPTGRKVQNVDEQGNIFSENDIAIGDVIERTSLERQAVIRAYMPTTANAITPTLQRLIDMEIPIPANGINEIQDRLSDVAGTLDNTIMRFNRAVVGGQLMSTATQEQYIGNLRSELSNGIFASLGALANPDMAAVFRNHPQAFMPEEISAIAQGYIGDIMNELSTRMPGTDKSIASALGMDLNEVRTNLLSQAESIEKFYQAQVEGNFNKADLYRRTLEAQKNIYNTEAWLQLPEELKRPLATAESMDKLLSSFVSLGELGKQFLLNNPEALGTMQQIQQLMFGKQSQDMFEFQLNNANIRTAEGVVLVGEALQRLWNSAPNSKTATFIKEYLEKNKTQLMRTAEREGIDIQQMFDDASEIDRVIEDWFKSVGKDRKENEGFLDGLIEMFAGQPTQRARPNTGVN